MMGGPGRHSGFLNQETSKPKSTSDTLGRLVKHFAPFWLALLAAVVFVVISTWAQVTNPELTGQLVDCYLSPAAAASGFSFPGASNAVSQSASGSNCWLAAVKNDRLCWGNP